MLLNVEDLFPEECRDTFKANTELTGQPSIGVLGVNGTSSVQINISAAGLSAGGKHPSLVLPFIGSFPPPTFFKASG